jgi:hypothetical protein
MAEEIQFTGKSGTACRAATGHRDFPLSPQTHNVRIRLDLNLSICRCEERSDEAISLLLKKALLISEIATLDSILPFEKDSIDARNDRHDLIKQAKQKPKMYCEI